MNDNDADLPTGLWAWTTKTHDGEWGLIGVLVGGFHTPMVFAVERVAKSDQMRARAQQHADGSGQEVRLVRFEPTVFAETLKPCAKVDP